jgi:hypothetical protein
LKLKKILLISYYFDPFPGVGAKRLSYWANAFEAEGSIDCTVVTATPQPVWKEKVVYIKDPDNWANKVFFGASWIKPLKKYLKAQGRFFDYVLLSGGPFGHFGVVTFLKEELKCTVILDFRDPFSSNVRFSSSVFTEFIKKRLEKRVLSWADHILTVNDCCKELLIKNAPAGRVSVVENGYDERIVNAAAGRKITDGRIHLVHAGKFYASPLYFAQALSEWNKQHKDKQFVFHHIGDINIDLQSLNSQYILQHGPKSYSETVEIMKSCSLGFLLTSGQFLEYNTKVFDYIGCDLDILILTEGEVESGCINGLTKKLGDRVFWSKVIKNDIFQFFQKYNSSNRGFFEKKEFTRKAGFLKLKKVLDRLG